MSIPIRISVRVDFADGAQHEYEVRSRDAAEALPGFWPEGVVTAEVAKRMEYEQERQRQIDGLLGRLAQVRETIRVADPDDVSDWQRGYRACSERVRTILDGA